MAELSEICAAARRVEPRKEPLWLATVMRVRGSAYRRPGARMLFSSGQVLAGSVSAGCLEASIVRKGPWLARERPVCIEYDGDSEVDDEGRTPRGSGCDGLVNILIERAQLDRAGEALSLIEECLATERRAALVTVFESRDPELPVGARVALSEGGALSCVRCSSSAAAALIRAAERALGGPPCQRALRAEGFEALLEVIEPPPHLFVFGSGPDVVPVVQFATTLGLATTICDTSARFTVRARFSATSEVHVGSLASAVAKLSARRRPLALVMSHHYPTDAEALALLLDSPARYIGVLGPGRRTRRMLEERFPNPVELEARQRGRLRAPVGLDLGAETPEQIALSVVAEIQAYLARASGESLSARTSQPIHSSAAELIVPSSTVITRTGTD